MKHIIQCFCFLVLSSFVASLPQPNEHHVHKTAVNNEDETSQQNPKIHKTPETEHKPVNEDGVYKNQNSYPHYYNNRRPVHQYHHGVHGYNPKWPPAYVGYDPHPAHRPLNPVLIPKPYHHDEKLYQDSGEDPVLYSRHLEREPRVEPIPLVYPDHHYPPVYPQISEHPYHGHQPLPLYHPQVHEYPPYPVHNTHVPRQSVLPIYLFNAPGGSQIRNYFQRILNKVPQRMNIKKKPKIIIEYLNGTVEYVDIPDLIEYAPGVVLNENGDKIFEGKDLVENIPPEEEISVAEPSYVFEPKYVPPSHIRENLIKARQKDGVVKEYIDDSVKPDIEVDSSGTPKVAVVVEQIVPEEVIISKDSPVVEPAEDSYYYIKQKQYVGRRPEYRYIPIEVRQKNINLEEPIDESYNDKSYPESRELPSVDITQDSYINSKNEPVGDPHAIIRKHYVSERPSRIQYRRIPANVRPENDELGKSTDEPYNEENYPDSVMDSSVPYQEAVIVGDDTPQDVPTARNPYLNPEYEYYIKQRQYVGQKPSNRGKYISRPIRYYRIPPNVQRDDNNPGEARDGTYKNKNDSGSAKDYGETSRETSIVRDSQQNNYPNSENEPDLDIKGYVVRRPVPDNGEFVASQNENQQNPKNVEPQHHPDPDKNLNERNNNDKSPDFGVDSTESIMVTPTDNKQNDYSNGENPVEGSYHNIKHPRYVQRRPSSIENEPLDDYFYNDIHSDSGVNSKEKTFIAEDDEQDEPTSRDNAENVSEVEPYESPEHKKLEESQVPEPKSKDNRDPDSVETEKYNSENLANDFLSNDDSSVSVIDTAKPSKPEQKTSEESQVVVSQNKNNRNPDDIEPVKDNSENPTNDSPRNDNSSVSDKDSARPSNAEQKPSEESQVIITQNKDNTNTDNIEPEKYNSKNPANDSPSNDDSSVSDIDTARPSNPEQKAPEESRVVGSQNKDNVNPGNVVPEKYNSENPANDSPSNDDSSVSDINTARPSNPKQKTSQESQVVGSQNKNNVNPGDVEPEKYYSENPANDSPSNDDSSVADIDTTRPSNPKRKLSQESQVVVSQNKDYVNPDNVEPEKYNSENPSNDSPSNDDSSVSDIDTASTSNVITKDTPTASEGRPNSEDNDTPDSDTNSSTQVKYYNSPTYVKPEGGDIEKPQDNSYKAGDYSDSSTDSSEHSTKDTTQLTTTTEDHPTIDNTEKGSDYNKNQKPDDIPTNVKHEDETIENIETNSNNDNDSDIDFSDSTVSTKQETTTTRTHQTNTENHSEDSYYNVKQKQAGGKPALAGEISKIKPKEDTEKSIDESANEHNLLTSKVETTDNTIVTSTIKQDDTTTNDDWHDSDVTKQKESKSPKAPSEKPIEDGPFNNDEPTSGVDKEPTTVTSTVIYHEQGNDHPDIENDFATNKKTKSSSKGQVTEEGNRNPSRDESENDKTEKPKDEFNYNYSESNAGLGKPSTVKHTTIYSNSGRDNYPQKDSVRGADDNKKQQPSDSNTSEYYRSTNDNPEYENTQKPTDDLNNNNTKESTIVKETVDDAEYDNDQPNENDSEPSNIVKQKHGNDDKEKPVDDFNKTDDNSNLKPGVDNKETTKVANTAEESTPTKDDQPKTDKIDSLKDHIPQNYDNVENENEKHVATVMKTSHPTIKPESSTPLFEESIKQSDVDGSTEISEEYQEIGPNDFDEDSSEVKEDNEVESTVNEPPLTSGTDDDKGYAFTTTENSIKSDKTVNVDSKEEKTPTTENSTVNKESNDENNPGGIDEEYKKEKPTTVETTKNTVPNQSKVDGIESTTTITTTEPNDFDDDQESVEDQDDDEIISNYSSNESGDYNSDNGSYNDNAEEFDDEPIDKENEEIDQGNEYAKENKNQGENEIEGNDQSPNDVENDDQGQNGEKGNNHSLNEAETNDRDQNNVNKNDRYHNENNSDSTTTQDSSSEDNTDKTTSTSTINKNTRESAEERYRNTIYNKLNDDNDAIGQEKHDQADNDNSTDEIILDSKEIACKTEENKNKNGCKNQGSSSEIVPLVSFHPDTDFYKKLIEEYNSLHFFRMNSSASLIHRDTKSLVYENGTVVDYLSETYWEKENDEKPIKVRTSQVIRQPMKKDENDC